MEIKKLKIDDFDDVLKFYKEQIDYLERKEFFYPYQNQDIINILNGGGIMAAVLDDQKIIGLSAIDFDENYGKLLKEIINIYRPHAFSHKVCEYSGVITHKDYRNQGVAGRLYDYLLDQVKDQKDLCLCSVVQLENQASLNFFFKRKFRLVSVKRSFDIDFGYLIKFLDKEIEVDLSDQIIINCLDYDSYKTYLTQGYAGVWFLDNQIKLCKII
ncbi:MAG TPA: GNAT family N-acetyltransferase [Clostridia bacterium]